jgi:predicted amino acid racemase
VFDYGYDSNAECDARAVAQLRKHGATQKCGQIVTLPNVGLQLLDVVTVTDARAGISSELYRVRGIEEVYDATKEPLVFEQRVGLGAR